MEVTERSEGTGTTQTVFSILFIAAPYDPLLELDTALALSRDGTDCIAIYLDAALA
jgi:hypothetical protein